MKIIDAEDKVLGRMASQVAQLLMAGEEVAIVNSEMAIITGKKTSILADFRTKRDIRHQRKGPFYPKMPDRIVKRSVKGMLPYKTQSGRDAYKRLKVYIGKPDGLEGEAFSIKVGKKLPDRYITIADISRELGANF